MCEVTSLYLTLLSTCFSSSPESTWWVEPWERWHECSKNYVCSQSVAIMMGNSPFTCLCRFMYDRRLCSCLCRWHFNVLQLCCPQMTLYLMGRWPCRCRRCWSSSAPLTGKTGTLQLRKQGWWELMRQGTSQYCRDWNLRIRTGVTDSMTDRWTELKKKWGWGRL